jgi:putative spermidine/putrescine transport system ATP-binding protein
VPGSHAATVDLVVPRGHFFEVYLESNGHKIRSFMSSEIPQVGATGFVRISKALIYKDGKLVKVA